MNRDRAEFHALGKGADDQRRRDRREGHLEAKIDELGNVRPDRKGRRRGVRRHAHQERLGQAADIGRAAGEGEAIAIDRPDQSDDADGVEDMGEHAQHVLGTHQAAIEQRQSRYRHEQDEHRSGQHPGIVAFVDYRCVRQCRGRGEQAGDQHGKPYPIGNSRIH
jgi:hypothetical protein